MNNDKKKTADYWSQNVAGSNPFSPDVYWLAVPEVQRRYQKKACANKPFPSWVEYCVKEFLGSNIPVQKMLSIGCGIGGLERHLFNLNAFQHCHAIDISPRAIEIAKQEVEQLGITSIIYSVYDVEVMDLAVNQYDAVWFNGSLHHIKELETVCNRVKRALKPGGWLFFNEYVGFNRFAFSSRQRDIIQHAFYLIPLRYRRSFVHQTTNTYQETPPIPDPTEVARTDPSEAVRSQDILPIVNKLFEVVTTNNCGGSLLQFLLSGIAGNFKLSDPQSMLILNMLFEIEDALIDAGDIQSDFVVLAARAN
ncbi:MAG: class I SAM-dependent methyltransferase [Candidatus Competibacter sp.]|nr:class I SAM-dependent methyltransferase [Candidatus Competibacter sp.]MDG4582711.1 class I SAM-dependent methyltransferase [Candidatus Competibacter sp.]